MNRAGRRATRAPSQRKYRGADTYVEFLDPDKRKADFEREKAHMDEVEGYTDKHPTYFPGHNDWVLEL